MVAWGAPGLAGEPRRLRLAGLGAEGRGEGGGRGGGWGGGWEQGTREWLLARRGGKAWIDGAGPTNERAPGERPGCC